MLTAVFDEHAPKRVVELTERKYARPTVSRTFEGRDRFAPAAAWLAKGIELTALGRSAGAIQRLEIAAAARRRRRIDGEVLRVDRFGNLITNIDRKTFDKLAGAPLDIRVGDHAGVAGSSRPTPTRRPARSARCSAAPTISRSRPTARAPPRRSIWGAARPCTSPAARDRIRRFTRIQSLAHVTCLTMIDFTLSDEHRLLEQSIREWGAREVAPFIHDNDRQHHFDRDRILGGMAKLGLLGISVPQEYGGAGMDYICPRHRQRGARVPRHVAARHHVGARRAELPDAAVVGHRRSEAALSRAAGAGQRRSPATGSPSPAPAATRAPSRRRRSKKGDRYVLNGEKSWISLADVADNFLVIAWTDLEKKKQRDPSGHDRLHRRAHVQGILERRR